MAGTNATLTLGLIGLLGIASVSCQLSTPLGPFRASTLAPSLDYLPPEETRTVMWVLAAELRHLERLMQAPTIRDPEVLRATVRGTLERMRLAAKTLDEPGRTTQHPEINQNLGLFLGRLERARRAVDRNPPNYFLAGTIAGTCSLCHGEASTQASWKNPAAATSR